MYTRDASGATGTFGVDVGYFDAGLGAGVTINFTPETTGVKPNYNERFSGRLISATLIDGTIVPTPSNCSSPFELADSATGE